MSPSVAIIMRAKDEMPYVQQTLNALQEQTFSAYTLYAVDSGSTDGTLQCLENTGCDLVQIQPEAYIPGKVLNDAVARTDRNIIVFLNADAIPLSSGWLAELLSPIMENEADAVFSKQVARPDAEFIVAYDYERAYRPGSSAPGFFSAVACAFKRELWENRPFPENGYAEDARWADMQLAAGARLMMAGKSVVEHSHNYSLPQLFQKRYRQARTGSESPHILKQILHCIREIMRDLIYAAVKLKLLTIPYNLAYRTTIHRAIYRGLKDR